MDDELIEKIVRMYRQRVHVSRIAERMHIHSSIVRDALRQAGYNVSTVVTLEDQLHFAKPQEPLGIVCKYPFCQYEAVTNYALVPLCLGHAETIHAETLFYYEKGWRHTKKTYEQQRPNYTKISKFVKWRNREHD